MPITLMLSHKLNKKMADLRRSGELGWLRPDSKTQVTVEYEKKANGAFVPRRVDTVVISTQHAEEISTADLQKELMEKVVKTVIPANLLDDKTVFHIQPSGRFVIGGPQGDAGLTGRKVIVDTYGGHGGKYRDSFPRSYGLRKASTARNPVIPSSLLTFSLLCLQLTAVVLSPERTGPVRLSSPLTALSALRPGTARKRPVLRDRGFRLSCAAPFTNPAVYACL